MNQANPGKPKATSLAGVRYALIAQVGLDRRVISVDGCHIKIVGVIDLCVTENYRNQGIGKAMLQSVEDYSNDRDFVVLMADDQQFYKKSGYTSLKPALTRWLAIHELQSHSVMERDLSDCFMYKPLSKKNGPVEK